MASSAMARQSSTSSHVSQSPSDAAPRMAPKMSRQHVVGQSRVQRNPSGKNLNKMAKPVQPTNTAEVDKAKHHRRSHSGNSVSAPSSPRPGFKRNASSGAIIRTGNHHNQGGMRKNHSSGHLARQNTARNATGKAAKHDVAPLKRALVQQAKSRPSSPDAHPTVHFDMGDEDDEDEPDDGWTEESASQSPTTTRSNTRSNSIVLEPNRSAAGGAGSTTATAPQGQENKSRATSQTASANAPSSFALPDRTQGSRQTSGGAGSTHHRSRPPDADMITSRLLQRNASLNPLPQVTTTAETASKATIVASHDARSLSQSAGSTLADTPNRDMVSRFITEGDGSAGTPKDSAFLPSNNSPQHVDRIKRNKSMPNVAGGAETPSKRNSSPTRPSGTSTPTDLPASRTAQKLMLQRASSNIEPQKLVPVILPRTGGPTFLPGMTYTAANGEGRLDPRLQQQFNHVAVEYQVMRRYRNPLADAMVRIEQMSGPARKIRLPPRSPTANGSASSGHNSGSNSRGGSLSTSLNEDGGPDSEGVSRPGSLRRQRGANGTGRVPRGDGQDEEEGRRSLENEHQRARSEAEELCRRLWESTEVVEGD